MYTASFRNLSGDAFLIVPKPIPRDKNDSFYGHLAAFARGAPGPQLDAFWKQVATQYLQELSLNRNKPLWLSTCGTGVAWLHVRLDSRPKYYSHSPFKTLASSERRVNENDHRDQQEANEL